mmetsp:Transcript_427/g.1932  ORF Transcript_427/g.1932 Transcript_427/m.1932 type:complete len:231 (+) Transcript_427:1293-1985(+)
MLANLQKPFTLEPELTRRVLMGLHACGCTIQQDDHGAHGLEQFRLHHVRQDSGLPDGYLLGHLRLNRAPTQVPPLPRIHHIVRGPHPRLLREPAAEAGRAAGAELRGGATAGFAQGLGHQPGAVGQLGFLLGTRRWHLLWFRLRNVGHLATRNVSDLWRHCQGVIVLSRGTFEVRYHCQHEVVVLRIEGEVLLGEGVRALGHHGCGHGWAPDDLPTLPGALALQRLQFPA